jgi:hypothetical protein
LTVDCDRMAGCDFCLGTPILNLSAQCGETGGL